MSAAVRARVGAPVRGPGQNAPDAAAQTLAAGGLRYSSVWEDHRLLERGLGAAGRGALVVVAGAGCNALNLVVRGARRVTAVDVNPAQTALVALKLAGARRLAHGEFLRLFGIRDLPGAGAPAADRLALYDRVRPVLAPAPRAWWDTHADVLAEGVDGAGRLDRYIADFRRAHLAPAAGVVDRLLAEDDATERARLFDQELCTPAFEAAFRAHFGREAMIERGRSAAQFAHVPPVDVAGWFLGRLRWACTALPTRGNHYLERFLRGRLADADAGPPYLRAAGYARLTARVGRVHVVTASLGDYLAARPTASADGLALSDVFEYLAPAASDALFAEAARVLRPGGRAAHWTLFVPRVRPAGLAGALRRLPRRSAALWRQDRAWFYGGFHVTERVGPTAGVPA